MSASERQTRLVVAEDWKKIYQSFRNADFQSYDFDNLRRTMINYLRQNYPEDFNDYIESSEFLALIDMVAFLGQNLSFRIDLNARENFLDTAERRESVLRLARMLAYNPSRNQATNGLLRIETLKTTENVRDSAGLNLSGTTIRWNDRSNPNFFEQFVKIFNSSMPVSSAIGNPLKTADISGVRTQKYRFNATNTDSAIYSFSKNIDGVRTRFEVVSTDIQGENIIEEPPIQGTSPAFLFRDDGQGAGSSNTGFFMHFRQGRLDSSNFSVNNPIPNQVISVETDNINDTDVWLYGVDTNGIETTAWTKLENINGNNVIYNSLFNGVKNMYSVSTRANDRINLVFSDGVFGNLPAGDFRVYYRVSNNAAITVSPSAVGTVTIEIPYQSTRGTIETLTVGLRLTYTVKNGAPSETNAEIKRNAPATYYTQDRLITGEDYNIGPLAISQEIIKTKSVNRISSGISRFFDLDDPSGKYSNTSLFADDGILYREYFTQRDRTTFNTQSDIEGFIYSYLEPVISSDTMRNFYLSEFQRELINKGEITWRGLTSATNRYTGQMLTDGLPLNLGTYADNNMSFVESGALCKFVPPTGKYYDQENRLVDSQTLGTKTYLWTKVLGVNTYATDQSVEGQEATISDYVPDGSSLVEIVPLYSNTINNDTKTQIIDRAFAQQDFALRYDSDGREWRIITSENVNVRDPFSLDRAGDLTGQNLDASWLVNFKTDGDQYTVTHRNLRYVFESANEIRFFFDNADQIYDPETGRVVRDRITVLNVNNQSEEDLTPFTRDFNWTITDSYRDDEDYVDTRKIQVQFFDADRDSVADDPDLFSSIIKDGSKVIFKREVAPDGTEQYVYYPEDVFYQTGNTDPNPTVENLRSGDVIYYVDQDVFKIYNPDATPKFKITSDYRAYSGRGNLKFHYFHVADSNYRIDPSRSNLIDTYLLTKSYDQDMREYARGNRQLKPLPPSSDQLFRTYNSAISRVKSISDDLIYHPVRYKLLFGDRAPSELQVSFKIVRNKSVVVNENELKSDVIRLIDQYFDIENWDFGETFYFQELSAYIMNRLSPKLVSIIIVPRQESQVFGSLFEIKSEVDEVFLSAATVDDVEIIDEITASNIQANGQVISTASAPNSQTITSASS